MALLVLLVGCGQGLLADGAAELEPPIGYYDAGWPIDACSVDLADGGTGYELGDVLPQSTFITQSGETAKLHDWCGHVVYIEIGYFT